MKANLVPALITLLSLASLGCATSRPVEELTRQLPYASRVELLDAEHRLALADDELRHANDAVRAAEDELAHAEREIAAARVAPRESEEAQARLAFLRANDALSKEKLRLAKAQARCAKLKYERDRIRLLEREQVAGTEKLVAAPVEESLAQCESRAEDVEAQAARLESRARAAEEDWERAGAQLALERPARADAPYLE